MDQPRYDYCEITFEPHYSGCLPGLFLSLTGQTSGRFRANANTAHGMLSAGVSRTFGYPQGVVFAAGGGQHLDDAREALDELAKYLVSEGWEPQPSGAFWYNLRFRHRALEGPRR